MRAALVSSFFRLQPTASSSSLAEVAPLMAIGGFGATTQLLAPKKKAAPKPKTPVAKSAKSKSAPSKKPPAVAAQLPKKSGKLTPTPLKSQKKDTVALASKERLGTGKERSGNEAAVKKENKKENLILEKDGAPVVDGGHRSTPSPPAKVSPAVAMKASPTVVKSAKSRLMPPPTSKASRGAQAWALRHYLNLRKSQQFPLAATRFRQVPARRLVINAKEKPRRAAVTTPFRGVMTPKVPRFRQRLPGSAVRVSLKQIYRRGSFPACTHPHPVLRPRKQRKQRQQRAATFPGTTSSTPAATVSPMGAFTKVHRTAAHSEAMALAESQGLSGPALTLYVFDQTNAIIGAKWKALSTKEREVYSKTVFE